MEEVRALIGGLGRFKSSTSAQTTASKKAQATGDSASPNHLSHGPLFWEDALVYIPAREWEAVDQARRNSILVVRSQQNSESSKI